MVTFQEHDHSYWNENGVRYTGATTLLGQFKTPFDTKGISERSAERTGLTAQSFVDKWAAITAHACQRGTHFHLLREESLYSSVFWNSPATGNEYPVLNQALWLAKSPSHPYPVQDTMPNGIYPEMLLWNHPTQTAGQADWVLLDDQYFDIDDWKTNKEIKQKGFFDLDFMDNQRMKGPLSHLQDCNWIHYQLQISLYAYMIEQSGRTARKLQFTHFPPLIIDGPQINGETAPPDENNPVIYPVTYMKDEIQAILEPRRKYIWCSIS